MSFEGMGDGMIARPVRDEVADEDREDWQAVTLRSRSGDSRGFICVGDLTRIEPKSCSGNFRRHLRQLLSRSAAACEAI
jgi:hypothetical protein